MHWPRTPVERSRHFQPPFCPWPECSEHRRYGACFRFEPDGSYTTARRRVPRFRCLACGRSFSRQSFSTTYYLKRPELLAGIAAGLQAGSAHRQIARSLGCAPSTVTRQSARLGRHALLLSARALAECAGRVAEPIVVDHFETFEFSQDLPYGVATAVGSESWFLYGLDPVPHGRSGRLSPAQHARRRARPYRPSRGGYAGSFRRILDLLLPLRPETRPLELRCDGKIEYRQAHASHPASRSIRLRCYPNPPRGPKGSPRSAEAIARDRAMFPVDALHGLIRHTASHHRRETIAFVRRLAAGIERQALLMVWRNFVKGRSERKPDPTTPAMHTGLATEPWTWRRVLARRLFPGRLALPPIWDEIYRRDWTTPVLPSNTRHQLKHAY